MFLLIVLGIICLYSTLLLGKCLDKDSKSKSYNDIGQQAFGAKGRVIVAIFVYLEIFMTLVSYTISLHDNIITVFSGVQLKFPIWAKLSTSHLLTILAVLVALPSLWLKNLSSISFLSFGGILMSAVIFSSVASTAIFGGVRADHKIPILQLHKIPAISGLFIFSYAGHIVFPNLYVAMKDPSKFKKVCYFYICVYVQFPLSRHITFYFTSPVIMHHHVYIGTRMNCELSYHKKTGIIIPHFSLSLSLSLYVCIYIYMCVCVCVAVR